MVRGKVVPLVVFLALLAYQSSADTVEFLVVDRFSASVRKDGIPVGWKKVTFPEIERHTVYTVERESDNYILKAVSRDSASAIFKEVDIELEEYPVLRWRWKVAGVMKKGDATRKEGDDYPARVYVTFEYDPDRVGFLERLRYMMIGAIYGTAPPGEAIVYIWANRLDKGRAVPSPYTDKVILVAVESGEEFSGRWMEEERNVYEDYRRFFGGKPPGLKGIFIMTDSDNTHSSATAWYDDILFLKE